jgi:hypothetical protein
MLSRKTPFSKYASMCDTGGRNNFATLGTHIRLEPSRTPGDVVAAACKEFGVILK